MYTFLCYHGGNAKHIHTLNTNFKIIKEIGKNLVVDSNPKVHKNIKICVSFRNIFFYNLLYMHTKKNHTSNTFENILFKKF